MYKKIDELINLWNSNRFPASWLFTSYYNSDLLDFTEEFLKQIIPSKYQSSEDKNLYSHPDIAHISLGKKQESENSKLISVEQIRSVIDLFSKSAARLPFKVAVIEDGEKLSIPASNCFLKTLEEPRENCYIFLLSTKPHNFLPTILSRVRKFNIISPSDDTKVGEMPITANEQDDTGEKLSCSAIIDMLSEPSLDAFTAKSEIIAKDKHKYLLEFTDNLKRIINDLLKLCLAGENLANYPEGAQWQLNNLAKTKGFNPRYFMKLYDRVSAILEEGYEYDLDIRHSFIRLYSIFNEARIQAR